MRLILISFALLSAVFNLANAQIPEPTVKVKTLKSQDITIHENLPARIEASRIASIHPQVSGLIQKRFFKEGENVKAGEILYQIDDAIYLANLQAAEASLKQAEANKALAESTAKRYAPLVKEQAISKQNYEQALAQVKVADAAISAAKASIKQAKINVEYTKVKAPISGIIGRSLVNEGNLVNSSVEMARVQVINPMYVNISRPAAQIIKMRRQLKQGKTFDNSLNLFFDDGSAYPHQGKLLFAEQIVDQNTGDLLLRAEIPNPDNELINGMYVRVNVPKEFYPNVFLVPQSAVVRGKQDMVRILNADNTYQNRTVKIESSYQNQWIISEGLQNGEKIILDEIPALQKSFAKVIPVEVE